MNLASWKSKLPAIEKSELLVVLAIVLFGFALRLCGVNFGLPYLYDFDERIFVDRAYYMLGNKDLNPQWFGAPASITIYLLCIAYVLIFAGGMALGQLDGASDFKALYLSDPTAFYLSGRLISVLFGTAIVVVVYLIGRTLMGHVGGCIAAFTIAVLPLSTAFSKLVRMDAPMIFFILVAFLFCLEVIETNSWWGYLGAGASIGLAIACKYPAVFFAPMVLAAQVLHWSRTKIFTPMRLIASGFASIVACFLTAPFVFLDFQQVLEDVVFESRSEHLGATSEGWFANLWWYFSTVSASELGWLGLFVAIAGTGYGLYRRRPGWILAVVAVALFSGIISGLSLRWDRWLLPIFPFAALFIAYAIVTVANTPTIRHAKAPVRRATILALTVAVTIAPLWTSLAEAKSLIGTDTRTLAAEWVQSEVPEGSRILLELGAPQLSLDAYEIFQVSNEGELSRVAPESQDAQRFVPDYRFIANLEDTDALNAANIDYVITTGIEDRYRREIDRKRALSEETDDLEQAIAVYETIERSGESVFTASPQAGVNRGTDIEIYALN